MGVIDLTPLTWCQYSRHSAFEVGDLDHTILYVYMVTMVR
jgi:hypothetical protein